MHTVRGEPAMATAVASDIDVAAGVATSTGTAHRRHLRAFGRMLWALLLIRLCTGCRGDAAQDLQVFQIDRRANLVREVRVAGEAVVRGGRHRGREAIAARYRSTVATLLAD